MSKITIYSPPATAQIKACAVDFDLRRAPVPVHLVQYDKTIPILAVSLYKGSSPYTLPADAEVNVRMNKRNNLCVYNPALGCNESRDVVYVAVTPQMTTQDGTFEPILEVVINSGVAGTSPMQLVIRRNPVQEDAIEDTSEAKTLTELVSQAAASATAAAQSAGAAAEDAGKAAASAAAAAESEAAAKNAAKDASDVKASIPADYSQMSATVSQLKEDTAKLKDGKISKFYASSQGDTNLPDSDDGRIMDLMLYGKSEQKQYSGKNLWGIGDIKISTKSDVAIDIPKGTYTFSRDGSTANLSLRLYWGDTDVESILIECRASKTVSFTVENNVKKLNWFVNPYVSPITKIQIEKGSTATDYEPYVGGIPSPNPEYPQEIKSVVKPVVKVCGKNLLDLRTGRSGAGEGVTYTRNDDGSYTRKGTSTGQSGNMWFLGAYTQATNTATLFVLKPGTYTVKDCVLFSGTNQRNGTFTVTNDWFVTGIRSPYMDVGVALDDTVYPRLMAGSTDTGWEPYTEQTATLPYTLNAIPVTSGGNVTIDGQQYIADYVDVERGKLVRMTGKLTIATAIVPGDALWYDAEKSYSYEIQESRISPSIKKAAISSDRLTGYDFGDFYAKGIETGILASESYIIVNISKRFNICTTADEFITWFNESNVIGVLTTPTETDLTAEEIAAFKALASHYPVTNVSTTSDQLDGYTVFDYPISLANGWNYVKQQLGDTRDYLYGIDLMTAEAYVNSEYAAALAEIEV